MNCQLCDVRPAEFVVWHDRQAYERIQLERRSQMCGPCAADFGGDRVTAFAFIAKAPTHEQVTAAAKRLHAEKYHDGCRATLAECCEECAERLS